MASSDRTAPRSVMERLSYAREVVRFNFDEAMLAHAEWKLKLHLFLQGDGSLDPDTVCRDDRCALGKWIYSDGMKYANDPDYDTLRKSHAHFHRCASEVVASVLRNDVANARSLLGTDSEYATISSQVIAAILDMKRRVEEKTALIMGNVTVGILVIDATMLVQSGYSQYCHDLLGARRVGGRHICELLGLEGHDFEHFEAALAQAFEDVLPPEVSLAMLPERVRVHERVVGLRAKAIRSTSEEVDYILFTLEDVSRLVALENERAEGLAIIRALRNRHAFSQFARDAMQRLDCSLQGDGSPDAASIRRDVHTIKGNAGLFELHDVVACASAIEDRAEIQHGDLNRLKESLRATLGRFETVLGFDVLDEAGVFINCNEATLRAFEEHFLRAPDEESIRQLFQRLLRRLRMRPVRAILGPIEDRVTLLASRLEKKVVCSVAGCDLLVIEPKVAPVLQALTHAIRNALDHGIESPEERAAHDKPTEGRLDLRFELSASEGLRLIVSDDGRGVDTHSLYNKALGRGLLDAHASAQMSSDQLLELVFMEGLSTAERVTEVSGRGVGMGALRDAARQAGGSIRIHTRPRGGTSIEIVIPDAAGAFDMSERTSSSG